MVDKGNIIIKEKTEIDNKCPYCHAQMADGYIQTVGISLAWTPKGMKPRFCKFRNSVEKHETRLGEYSFKRGGIATAYKCTKCNVVIIKDLK